MFVRTRFNYDRNAISVLTGHFTNQEENDGKTQQNFKEECDINTIVNNFLKTGQMPDNIRLPQYVDYEGVFDFQSAMNTMMQAEESFMQIPAPIRAQFDNSPQKFLEFCANPNNIDKMREYGFAPPAPPPEKPAEPPAPVPAST